MTTKDQKTSKTVDGAINQFAREVEASYNLDSRNKEFTYANFFQNKMLIIHAIRKGFPYSLFSEIQKITPFSEKDWAEFLNISAKTLQRHKNEKGYYFKPIHTEKIIELAEVTQFGKEVFDSPRQFYSWLNTPSYALGSLEPIELLKDSYGKELVMAELNRIENGIFA